MSKILNHKIILGTVQMGVPYGINNTVGKIPLKNSHAILEHAFNNDIRILDTAEAYGNAHEVIGAFHENHSNKLFEVITKLPHEFDEKIGDKVDHYLKELRVNQLNALLFHSFSRYKKNTNNLEVLLELKQNNKINNIGVSVYTNEEIEEVISNKSIDIIQLPFNLFDNLNLRGDLLKKAKANGKQVHTRSAFLQGLFFKDTESSNLTVQGLKTDLIKLSKIMKDSNVSIVQLALNYCLQQANIDNVLIGVDSVEQLETDLKVVEKKLSSQILAEVNVIKIRDINLLNPSLWH